MTLLPQQRLLLELIAMSGDIALSKLAPDSILWRTAQECRAQGWLALKEISPGIHKASMTPLGRSAIGATLPPR
jgi:hypothetical protein